MAPPLQILRSIIAGRRPTGKTYGEPYVNFADNQFGVFDSSNNARDLIGVPVFSVNGSYAAGVSVSKDGIVYVAQVAVSPGAWNPAQWSAVASTAQLVGTAGSRALLMSQTISGTPAASVNLFYAFPNTYDQYQLEIYDLTVSADGAILLMRVSLDGSTWDVANDYWNSGIFSYTYPSAGSGNIGGNNPYFFLSSGISSTAVNLTTSHVRFSLPWSTSRQKSFDFQSSHFSSSNGYIHLITSGFLSNTNAIKGLQLLLSAGNITRGVFNLYGITRSGGPAP